MKQIYNALQRKEKKEKNYEKNIVDHHDMKSESAQNSSSVLPWKALQEMQYSFAVHFWTLSIIVNQHHCTIYL